jgi:hypothetical protein
MLFGPTAERICDDSSGYFGLCQTIEEGLARETGRWECASPDDYAYWFYYYPGNCKKIELLGSPQINGLGCRSAVYIYPESWVNKFPLIVRPKDYPKLKDLQAWEVRGNWERLMLSRYDAKTLLVDKPVEVQRQVIVCCFARVCSRRQGHIDVLKDKTVDYSITGLIEERPKAPGAEFYATRTDFRARCGRKARDRKGGEVDSNLWRDILFDACRCAEPNNEGESKTICSVVWAGP